MRLFFMGWFMALLDIGQSLGKDGYHRQAPRPSLDEVMTSVMARSCGFSFRKMISFFKIYICPTKSMNQPLLILRFSIHIMQLFVLQNMTMIMIQGEPSSEVSANLRSLSNKNSMIWDACPTPIVHPGWRYGKDGKTLQRAAMKEHLPV